MQHPAERRSFTGHEPAPGHSDNGLATLPVPESERQQYLFVEMVCLLYARGLVSLGRGAEMLGMSKFDFGLEAGRRDIPRHYSEAALKAALQASRVIIDEADGRAVAFSPGLAFTGLVGILIEARKREQIASLKAELHRLITEARFFIAPRLELRALAAVGERTNP